MKKFLSIIAVLSACTIAAAALTACGGKKTESKADNGSAASAADVTKGADATEAPADDGLSDFEWMKFQMPDGYEAFEESNAYTTIQESSNTKHKMKFFDKTKTADAALESIVDEDITKDTSRYSKGEIFEMGSYTWIAENFTFNDNDSRKFYALLDDTHYVYITVYEMTEADEAVKTVLKSFTADPSKL